MKKIFILIVSLVGLTASGFSQKKPRTDLDGNTYFPNGTVYISGANEGKQGTVVTGDKDMTMVNCEEFQEICRELLEEAWDSMDPDQPDQGGSDGGTDTGGSTDTGSSGGSNDDNKDSGSKQSNSLAQGATSKLDPQYRARLRTRYGIWHKNVSGRWFFIKDSKAHMARILKNIE